MFDADTETDGVRNRLADESFAWVGAPVHAASGWPCLDFVNSVEWRLSDWNEFLSDYADLVRWARHVRICGEEEARRLLAEAAPRPAEAAEAYAAAISLRESLYTVFSAAAAGSAAPAHDLAHLNTALAKAAVPERLTQTPRGFARQHLDPRDDLAWPLNPVVRSAADLLTSGELARLKECPGGPTKACGFLFIDETRNRSRRWCSSRTCGNRARLHRHYARKLPGPPRPGSG